MTEKAGNIVEIEGGTVRRYPLATSSAIRIRERSRPPTGPPATTVANALTQISQPSKKPACLMAALAQDSSYLLD